MQFINNQKDWISKDLMEILKTRKGDKIPIWDPKRGKGHPLLDQLTAWGKAHFGESIPQQYFHIFKEDTKDIQDFEFVMPNLPKIGKNIYWWFVKLQPGEIQLMHYDMHILGAFYKDNTFSEVVEVQKIKNPIRYTMFLQDYQPGHIFTYKDQMLSNYKAGDIYEWSDPELLHGVANISFTPRYTLQITSHD